MTHGTIQRSRMLLVEDERVVLTALKKFFTREGFHVDCARELEEAEALIATSHYAIVIADLRLSWSYAVEGLEILRFVRHHSRGTRVIILTRAGLLFRPSFRAVVHRRTDYLPRTVRNEQTGAR